MATKPINLRAIDYSSVSLLANKAILTLKESGQLPTEVKGAEYSIQYYEGKNRIDNITFHKEFDPTYDYGSAVLYDGSFVEITGEVDKLLRKLLICADNHKEFIDQVVENLNFRIDYLIGELRIGLDKTISDHIIDKITFDEQLEYLKDLRKSILAYQFKIEKFEHYQIEIYSSFVNPQENDKDFIKIELKVKDGQNGKIIDFDSSQKSSDLNEPPTERKIDANYISCIFYIICKSHKLDISGKINQRLSDLFAQTISSFFFRNRETDALHNIEKIHEIEFDMDQLNYLESICRLKSKPIKVDTILDYFKSSKRFNFIETSIPLSKRIETIKSICNHKSFKNSPRFQEEFSLFLKDPNDYLGIPLQ